MSNDFASFARRSTEAESAREKYLRPTPPQDTPAAPADAEAPTTAPTQEPAPAPAPEPATSGPDQDPPAAAPATAAKPKTRRTAPTKRPQPQPTTPAPAPAPELEATEGAASPAAGPKRRNTTFALTASLVKRIEESAPDIPAGVLVVLAVQWAYSNGSLTDIYGPVEQLPADALFAPLEPTRRRVRRDEHTVVWNARLRPDDFTTLDELFVRLGAPNRNDLVFHALDLYVHHLEHDK